ncbi:MAG: ribonuclease HI family protein [Gemmataceae bacterium]|nr:ribonuclease HI family protein [Gemmataceae bacterium]
MSSAQEYHIYTDGGARGNPGPAGFGYVIQPPGQAVIEEQGFLGTATNNIAEYTGLVRALEHAQKLGARRVVVFSDSELMVKQMNGEYKVRNPGLLELFEEAKELCKAFESVKLRHVPRAENKHADRLYNEALDRAEKSSPKAVAKKHKPKPGQAELEGRVRDDALTCLRASALAWSRGNEKDPPPEMVWEQLWSLLADAGVLRS